MKPDHFRCVSPKHTCAECVYKCWVSDKSSNICTKHAFTIVLPAYMNVCDDFSSETPLILARLTDLLSSDEAYKTGSKSISLLLTEAHITTIRSTEAVSTFPEPKPYFNLSGTISGSDQGVDFRIDFKAAKAFFSKEEV